MTEPTKTRKEAAREALTVALCEYFNAWGAAGIAGVGRLVSTALWVRAERERAAWEARQPLMSPAKQTRHGYDGPLAYLDSEVSDGERPWLQAMAAYDEAAESWQDQPATRP